MKRKNYVEDLGPKTGDPAIDAARMKEALGRAEYPGPLNIEPQITSLVHVYLGNVCRAAIVIELDPEVERRCVLQVFTPGRLPAQVDASNYSERLAGNAWHWPHLCPSKTILAEDGEGEESASRNKNVSGAADSGNSNQGGSRATPDDSANNSEHDQTGGSK